jgi:hypothetical protein
LGIKELKMLDLHLNKELKIKKEKKKICVNKSHSPGPDYYDLHEVDDF